MMAFKKAFVFSLDAFVAFSIAIVIIYSLIYFSSIPYGYYGTLMQAHYLAKDSLVALSEARNFEHPEMSELGVIVGYWDDEQTLQQSIGSARTQTIEKIGVLIPEQFGYILEIQNPNDKSWYTVYDTKDGDSYEKHDKTFDKVIASSETVVFGYKQFATDQSTTDGFYKNPYGYITCTGDLTQCGTGVQPTYPRDNTIMANVRLIVYT